MYSSYRHSSLIVDLPQSTYQLLWTMKLWLLLTTTYALKQCDFDTLKDGEWLNDNGMFCSHCCLLVYIPLFSDNKQLHELDYG